MSLESLFGGARTPQRNLEVCVARPEPGKAGCGLGRAPHSALRSAPAPPQGARCAGRGGAKAGRGGSQPGRGGASAAPKSPPRPLSFFSAGQRAEEVA